MMSWGLASGVFELKLCVGPAGGLRRWKRDVGQWHRGREDDWESSHFGKWARAIVR